MRASVALVCLALTGCQSEREDPVAAAEARCRAHYDILWRWLTAHGRVPETQEELARAAQLPPRDPWGNPYHVETEGGISIWSDGPDGQPNTADDIGYPSD